MAETNEIQQDPTRIEVLKKIEEFEKIGNFNEDVEDDPVTGQITPNMVDYERKKLSSKFKTWLAYKMARKFMNKIIEMGALRIKDIEGVENFQNLKTGAIITCNHFNQLDSFAMQAAYDASKHKKRKMFKVIKEGNFLNCGDNKLFAFLMQNAYTLPLSSNRETMRKFLESIKSLLKKGHFILVYPEQAMWWNYRKPRPLKKGAFKFAVDNNVPVLPIFITMENAGIVGPDGFQLQDYTIHINPPIYKDEKLSDRENIDMMMQKNYDVWKDVYEKTYNKKLEYLTKK